MIISLALRKGEIREGQRLFINPEPIPTLPLKREGLIGRINIYFFILSSDYFITTYSVKFIIKLTPMCCSHGRTVILSLQIRTLLNFSLYRLLNYP